MPLVLAGTTSGATTIQATDGATQTITLPNNTGTVVTDTATQTLTNKTLTSPAIDGTPTGVGVLTSGTSVASTSGTSIDFTSIPSWVKRITVMFSDVSTNGTSFVQVQLGDSGGIETSGYLGASSEISAAVSSSNYTSGFGIQGGSASNVRHGIMTISLLNSATNTWSVGATMSISNLAYTIITSGFKSLSATLDRIRITTVNGTDAFDAGSINILYE